MSQEPSHDLAVYLRLQDFDVEEVELVEDRRFGKVKLLRVRRWRGRHACGECGKRHARGPFDEFAWIGVDEVSRTGGHVYFTVVTDLETGKVVWIGDGKGEKGFLPFVEALGPAGCRGRIRGVVSDLGYKSLVEQHLPGAIPILDRFHIVQWMNEALNQLRPRLFTGAPQDELGRTLKVKKRMLLSARERLGHKSQRFASKRAATAIPSTTNSRSSNAAACPTTHGPRSYFDPRFHGIPRGARKVGTRSGCPFFIAAGL